MKIDGHSPNSNIQPTATHAVQATKARSGSPADKVGTGSGPDTVALSAEAQLVGRAIREASSGPAVRQDRVEQAKQKLAAGQVGQDADRLAGKIVDHLIDG
jgi:flagellar biosynthesis anti-sigma factor FlgM